MELKLSSVAKVILWLEPQPSPEYNSSLLESIGDVFEVDNCTAAQILDEVQNHWLARWVETSDGFILQPSPILVSVYAHARPKEREALRVKFGLEPYQISIVGRILADVSLNDACALMSIVNKEIPDEYVG